MSHGGSGSRPNRRTFLRGLLLALVGGAAGIGSREAGAQTVLYDAYGQPVYQATPPAPVYGAPPVYAAPPLYVPAPVGSLGPYSAAGQSRRVARRTSRRTSARWN